MAPNAQQPARARLRDGYFGRIQRMLQTQMIPFQWRALNDLNEGAERSGCVANLRSLADGTGEAHYGFVFQDSDLAKWLEAAAYSLALTPDAELEAQCDSVIDLIGRGQMEDGYFNSYYQLTDIGKRWTNLRDHHELYCAGHLLEAAVAYKQATGKDRFLNIMRRFIRHIDSVLGPEPGKLRGYPGHQELELALCRLYRAEGDEDALRLARYFIDERGREPFFFAEEAARRGDDPPAHGDGRYWQSHAPVRDQETLGGHSVRALYMLAGMIDVARETGDDALMAACYRLFDNAVEKRMYITGGVGSTSIGEAFTLDYDLPPELAYAETCASIALVFVCRRLLETAPDGRVADVLGRALYNTCLAGMSLDGRSFFYVNPLEVQPEASRLAPVRGHVLPERPKWFRCACCPPNLARLLLSLGGYQYTQREDAVYMHLFLQGEADFSIGGQDVRVQVDTAYPDDGQITVRPSAGSYTLFLHLPAWCREYTLLRNGKALDAPAADGYLRVDGPFADGDTLELSLAMTPERNYANLAVRSAVGRVALSRGPVVYCLESVDNGENLHALSLPPDAALDVSYDETLLGGTPCIRAEGKRLRADSAALYAQERTAHSEPAPLLFIPYARWANRGANEMMVWVAER